MVPQVLSFLVPPHPQSHRLPLPVRRHPPTSTHEAAAPSFFPACPGRQFSSLARGRRPLWLLCVPGTFFRLL